MTKLQNLQNYLIVKQQNFLTTNQTEKNDLIFMCEFEYNGSFLTKVTFSLEAEDKNDKRYYFRTLDVSNYDIEDSVELDEVCRFLEDNGYLETATIQAKQTNDNREWSEVSPVPYPFKLTRAYAFYSQEVMQPMADFDVRIEFNNSGQGHYFLGGIR